MMMKTSTLTSSMSVLLVLFSCLLHLSTPPLAEGVRFTQTIDGEKRNIIFSSRHLEGHCTNTCAPSEVRVDPSSGPEPTPKPNIPPTLSPTEYPTPPPTPNPTTNPTPNPTPNPTKNPTPSPTKNPTPNPTKNPTPNPTKNPTPNPTANPTPQPTSGGTSRTPPSECPYFSLDFNDLDAGTYVHNELWYTHGVSITAKGKGQRHTPIRGQHVAEGGGAMVFDTYRPTGNTDLGWGKCSGNDGDSDLGAPNSACNVAGHKPGHGPGGAPNSAWGHPNCEPLGNVLVIQESNKPCPDDTGDGGWLTFEFHAPTEVNFAKLLDVDEPQNNKPSPRFKIYYANGQSELTAHVDATGDNGVIDFVLNKSNVVKVELEFWGSGSIAELNYRFCPPDTGACPLTTWNFDDLTAGEYIHDELWNSRGVKVTAKKTGNKGYTPLPPNYDTHNSAGGGAMVFDTLRPRGRNGQTLCGWNDGDKDLGAPNNLCSGPGPKPGRGAGGAEFINDELNRFRNCERLGNVLIIQESDKPCPDDSQSGGWITFDFKVPSSVQMAALLDVDEGTTPDIGITYGNGDYTTIHTEATDENGLLFQPILLDEVTQIEIRYYGSGSISELTYSNCPSYA